jgi:hypothetical protein
MTPACLNLSKISHVLNHMQLSLDQLILAVRVRFVVCSAAKLTFPSYETTNKNITQDGTCVYDLLQVWGGTYG